MKSGEMDAPSIQNADEGNSSIDFFLALARHRKIVVSLTVAAGVVALVVAFFLPKWYTGTTKIMPPQQSQSNAVAILGQLGAIAGGAATQALGLKNPSDIYVAILKSRSIADALVQRFDLRKVYDEDLLSEARKELARNSSISAGREGIITIEVEDRDSKRAASIANAYVEELRNRTLNLAVSEAGQRRLFFEGQLKKARGELSTAETELKKFSETAGLINPQGQIGLTVAAAAAIRAQIAAKEIQLTAMRSFATDGNPDLKRTLQELAGLRTELAKLEKNSGASKGDSTVSFGNAPEIGLEYTRKYRDVKYNETLFEVLARQYEIARIDEAKDATLIQVLDAAIEPERKTRPRILAVTSIGALLGLLLALFYVWMDERLRTSPELRARLARLRVSIADRSRSASR